MCIILYKCINIESSCDEVWCEFGLQQYLDPFDRVDHKTPYKPRREVNQTQVRVIS